MPLNSKKAIIAFIAFAFFCHSKLQAQSEKHRTETWSSDYSVDRVEHSGGYTMITGYFNQVGKYSGSGLLVNSSTSDIDNSFPKINGSISASVSDGNGGWYIGGSFTFVDDVEIRHLAHIKADKKLDTNWKPNPAGNVYAMAIDGTTLYVGGTFQSINGQSRNFLAAFDTTNGSLKDWNPNCNNVIYTIAVNGNTVYAGGLFTSVGGQTRNRIAAINATTAVPTSWDAAITGTSVLAITAAASTVYIGGNFTAIDGTSRPGLGAVNTSTGALLSWNPNPFDAAGVKIYCLLLSGNTLYVGGKFASIDGLSIPNMAAIDATTGSANNSWIPDVSGAVYSLTLSGSSLFIGGEFFDVNGTAKQCIAGLSTSNASLTSFDIVPRGVVNTISANGSNLFVGGEFSGVNWINRNGFALFKNSTDELWPYPITLNSLGQINTIAAKDDVLYIGGQFTDVNGQSRKNIAALSLTDGQLLSWNPTIDIPAAASNIAEVLTMKIKDNLLFVGGTFMQVSGQSRPSLAAIDLATGAPTSWNPIVGSGTSPEQVLSIDILNNTIYAAGSFSLVGGETRYNLAAVDATSGNVLPWAPEANAKVWKIRVTPTLAYVVGAFDAIGSSARDYNIAAIDLSTGEATAWSPDFQSGSIMDVALTANDVIVAGYYSKVGTELQNGLASFSQATGELNNWKPDVGQTEGGPLIEAVEVSQNRIQVGGSFEYVGEESRSNYAEYSTCAAAPSVTFDGAALSSTTAESYQWYMNDQMVEGATNQSLDILLYEYGVYAVEVTINGCTGRSDDFVYLITGNKPEGTASAKVFPNPVENNLALEVENESRLTIVDVTGQEIYNTNLLAQDVNHINTEALLPGTYILVIKSETNTNYFKIHKTR
jgi:hypothetical protein